MNQKKLDELLNNRPVISYNSRETPDSTDNEKNKETEAIMLESDRNDPNRVKYRIHGLEQSFDTIRSAIFGYSTSFRDYVTDENGKLSETKIRDFIEKMIEVYPQKDTLSPEKRRFIELFLYCAIVGPSSDTRYETEVFEYCVDISDSFSDLIKAAKDPGLYIEDPVRFASEEKYDSLMPEYAYGFLSSLNMVWDSLYKKTPDDYYTPEQKKAAADIYEDMTGYDYETGKSLYDSEAEESTGSSDEPVIMKDSADAGLSSDSNSTGSKIRFAVDDPETEADEEQSIDDDVIEELYEFPEPDYELLEAEKQATLEYFNKKWSEYIDFLPADHRFGDMYKEFRDMFFVTEHSDLVQIIIGMTESFLISEELSPLCMGNEYGIIANTLEKSARTIVGKVAAAEDLSKKRNDL